MRTNGRILLLTSLRILPKDYKSTIPYIKRTNACRILSNDRCSCAYSRLPNKRHFCIKRTTGEKGQKKEAMRYFRKTGREKVQKIISVQSCLFGSLEQTKVILILLFSILLADFYCFDLMAIL